MLNLQALAESEVKQLCDEYKMPFDETKRWYDRI